MKKIVIIVGLVTMACTASTKVFTSYQDWDSNKDGGIQRAEFVDGYAGSNYFKKWGKGANFISYDDFLKDAFMSLDKNKDSNLDRGEFESQIDIYYFGTLSNSFGQWDKNSNGSIEKAEFIDGAKMNKLASLWDIDRDKSISEYEMASGMFDLCNANKDLKVDQQEFDTWRAKRDTDVSSAQVVH